MTVTKGALLPGFTTPLAVGSHSMEGRIRLWSFILAATFCLSSGCGSSDKSASSESAASGGGSDSGVHAGASKKRVRGDTADAAVLNVVDALKEDRVDAVWEFLPASYQSDLNELAHLFAARMDSDLWDKTIGVLRKLARMLKEKREFVAAARAGQMPADQAKQSAAELAAIADLLDTLVASDLADLEKLKTVDGGKFLAATGRKLFGQLRAMGRNPLADPQLGVDLFADLKVTLDSSQGDTALLTFEAPNATSSGREFVRVEGKWIPKEMADHWIDFMGQARSWLAVTVLNPLEAAKPQAMALLSAIDESLVELLAARSEKQFTAAMTNAAESLAPFQQFVAGFTGPGTEEEFPDENAASDEAIELVTVVVKAMLTDDSQDALCEKLKAATDDRARTVSEITGDDETTTFKVGPVKDVAAFADRLDFLKITNVDSKTRVVTAAPKK
jgi:hypothetical protein